MIAWARSLHSQGKSHGCEILWRSRQIRGTTTCHSLRDVYRSRCVSLGFSISNSRQGFHGCLRKRQGAQLDAGMAQAQLTRQLECSLLAGDLDTLLSWVDPNASPIKTSVLKTAHRYCKDVGLATFVQAANHRRGSVVATGAPFEKHSSMVSQHSTAALFLRAYNESEVSARKSWVKR